MRTLLILVIILNVMNGIGIALRTFLDSEDGVVIKVGMALDAALWPMSLAIIATAILQIYPYKRKTDSLD